MNSTQKPHPVDVAMSEMALSARTPHPEEFESSYQMREAQPGECVNSTDITLRAPGHGQGTEEERVERVRKAFKVAWDTMAHVDINIDRDKIWFDKHPTMIEAMFGLSDAIKALAAADAVPGPEVKWTTEAPKETDTWWWVQIETLTPQIVFYIASDTVLKSGDERPHHVHEFSRWWPVPISAPPRGGTK